MPAPTRVYVVRSITPDIATRLVEARTAAEAERFVTSELFQTKPITALEMVEILKQNPGLQVESAIKGA